MKPGLLVVLFIVLCACGRKNENQINDIGTIRVIDILSEPGSEITNLSDIATDIDYIPLQTTANSLVGSIESTSTPPLHQRSI